MADTNRVTQLTDKYYLVRDSFQMWISVKANGPKGDYFKRITGYYTNFEGLMQGFAEEKIKTTEAKDATRLLKLFTNAEKELKILGSEIGQKLDGRVN